MGAHTSGFQPWVVPVQMGFFALAVLVGVALLVDVLRLSPDRSLGSWPAPRVRWAVVPAAFLVIVGLQVVLVGLSLLSDKSIFAAARAALVPVNAGLGLATFGLAVATLAEGIAYLLRVVFPSERRRARTDVADMEAEDEDEVTTDHEPQAD